MGAAGRARAPQAGLALSARNERKWGPPEVPTSGGQRAGPEMPAPKGPAVCDSLEGQAKTRGGGEMWRGGREGHLQRTEGAEGVESGQEARGPTSSAVLPQATPLSHSTGLGEISPEGASAPAGACCLSPGKREEGDRGQGALLGGAKYLGRRAWHLPSPGSPGAAAGRGWPASGREWVQEKGHGQEPEVKSPPTRHPL